MQPDDIEAFAVKYFERKAAGLPEEGEQAAGDDTGLTSDTVEQIVRDLFKKYDQDGNGYLDPREFKTLMQDLQSRMQFPADDIYRFLAEADLNADGMVEYEEFIPLALQIVQSIYAKKAMEQHVDDIEEQAAHLVHGMSREELTDCVANMFSEIDADGSGVVSRPVFVEALTSMDLGLTRREINTILFQVDEDQDGMITYREFINFAYELLQKLTSMRLLETTMEGDEFAQYLADLFRSRDTELTGSLPAEDMRDLIHEANLGLSRMQIYTVLSEARFDAEGMVSYVAFIPRAAGVIRAMLSFTSTFEPVEQDDAFVQQIEAVLSALPATVSAQQLQQALEQLQLDEREVQAIVNAGVCKGGTSAIPVHELMPQVWPLIKAVRSHKTAF